MPLSNFIGALCMLALLAAVAPAAQAQVAVAASAASPRSASPAPVPLPPAAGPRQLGPGQPGAQALSSFTGTLVGYRASTDDQVYDAFGFKTNAGTEVVRFPRHLGQALLAAAKPGSRVILMAFRAAGPLGRPELHLVSLTAGSQTVRDTPPPRPAGPPTEQATTVRGTVRQLAQDPLGRTTAIILADGTVLRLPPAAAEQLADKLTAGASVAATGVLRAPIPGEVVAKPVRVVRAQTITLGGVQFLLR